MCSKVLFSIVLVLVCTASGSWGFNIEEINAYQKDVMQLMMRTLAIDAHDERVNTVDANACFNYYLTEQEDVGATYNKAYISCITTADDARAAVSEANAKQRSDMLSRGGTICGDLNACEDFTDGLEFFQCYSKASENYQDFFLINSDSQALVQDLQVTYQQIQNDENKCTSVAYNSYVNGLANCNTNLNKCLSGEFVPPVPTEPTETTEGDVTTTEASTTEEVTTVDDSSTTEEVVTTEEPSLTTELPPEEDIKLYDGLTLKQFIKRMRTL